MKRLFVYCILSIFAFSISTGCWDIQDISRRAFVTAIGVDLSDNKYKVTFEILKPSGLKQFSHEPASIIQTIESKSISQAIEQLHTIISRPISLSHLKLLLIGEEMAKTNIYDTLDFFQRNSAVTLRMPIMFVQNEEAKTILHQKPLFQKYLSQELVSFTRSEYNLSLAKIKSFYELLNNLNKTDGNSLANRIMLIKNEDGKNIIVFSGGAILNEWKLIGWLNDKETQAVNWITGEANATIFNTVDDDNYVYKIDKKSINIKPEYKNDELFFSINLKIEGIISEKQKNALNLTKPQNIEKLEKDFSDKITAQIKSAVDKAQNTFRADYLGLGLSLNRYNPKLYESLNWKETFPKTSVQINVNTHITRFGLAE